MLAEPLLRARSRSGTITPLFCATEEEVELAERVIGEFREAWKNREKKAELDSRIDAAIESRQGGASNDFAKLVRGLAALLERRCVFMPAASTTAVAGASAAFSPALFNPAAIRRAVFEESSKRGFALTPAERTEIAGAAAAKLQIASPEAALEAMWSDLEDNLVLDRFDELDAKALVGWYNLSLAQTLLFRSTRLDFYVSGGQSWKRVLRQVKRLGLMYYLHHQNEEEGGGKGEKKIVCSLEGPPGLFKLTDRYGTALAKLLPAITFSGGEWAIRAWVLRRTFEGEREEYEFKMSAADAPALLSDPIYAKESAASFDSMVEEKFARRFASAAGDDLGWTLVREPDPLVVSGGRAFIPDFMFEKPGRRKVCLEIVGFWTPEYLERKFVKLADVFGSAYSTTLDNNQEKKERIELFIALDEDLACSRLAPASFSHMQRVMPRGRLLLYRKGSVPVSPILECLKAIDREAVERSVGDSSIKLQIDPAKDVIMVSELVQKSGNLPAEAILKIIERDYGDRYIEVAGKYLISKEKADKLESMLAPIKKFADACTLFSKEGIPEPCHAELVSKLGYDAVWESLDPSAAAIVKRK